MSLQIGTTIAQARRAKNLTQEALADMLGVSAAAVSKWETSASYPDITLLSPLARALGLTIDTLLDFRAAPTDEELTKITAQLRKIFDGQALPRAGTRSRKRCANTPQAVRSSWSRAVCIITTSPSRSRRRRTPSRQRRRSASGACSCSSRESANARMCAKS